MEPVNKDMYLRISSEEMLTGRVVKTRPEILDILKTKYYEMNADKVNVELTPVENNLTKEEYEVVYIDGQLVGKANSEDSRLLRTSPEFLNALKVTNTEISVDVQEEIQVLAVEPVVEPVIEPVIEPVVEPTVELEVEPELEKEEEKELSFDELMVDINSIVSDNINYKKQIDSMLKEVDKVKKSNVDLKEEAKSSKKEIEALSKRVTDLENENQSLERSLKALDDERIKTQAKYEEELQAERLAKENIEQFHEKKYKEKEEKILKYLSAAISRGTDQEEKELPRQLN